MRSRRDGPTPPTAALRAARVAFRSVDELVDEARAALLLGVPSGRAPRLPLAEALAGFELGLRQAESDMPGWRRPEVEPEWQACRGALLESARRAERLRLEEAPEGYGELAPVLDELLDPLEAFGAAARRLRALGA